MLFLVLIYFGKSQNKLSDHTDLGGNSFTEKNVHVA